MGITERKVREKAERQHRITTAAQKIAEAEGWSAVTIRRLALEIEYSQPVVYSHFANRDAIVGAVAVKGFAEIAQILRDVALASSSARDALAAVATSFLDFAFERPALYEAMFVLPSGLRFAKSDTPVPLRETFGALSNVIAPFCKDAELATETFWAALHGLAELERHGRIRAAFRSERIAMVVRAVGCAQGSEG